MADLAAELDALDPDTAAALEHWGFDRSRLLGWAEHLLPGDGASNRVRGEVTPPLPEDIDSLPDRTSDEGRRLELLGLEALRRGELAVVVLAGGMATRMGGVVKALVEIRPGLTFLDARLAEREHWSAVADAPLPLVLMTSYATDDPIRETLGDTLDGRAGRRVHPGRLAAPDARRASVPHGAKTGPACTPPATATCRTASAAPARSAG